MTSGISRRSEECGSFASCSGGPQAILYDTCARMEPLASYKPSKLLRHDPQYNQRSSDLGPPHPRTVVDPHEYRAGVIVAQDDVGEAVNKVADAQLEAGATLQRAEKTERSANEIRPLGRKLLKRLRNLERQVLGHAQAGPKLRPISSARQARREAISV